MEVEKGPGDLTVEVLGEVGAGGEEAHAHPVPVHGAHLADPLPLQHGQHGQQQHQHRRADKGQTLQPLSETRRPHGAFSLAAVPPQENESLHPLQIPFVLLKTRPGRRRSLGV